VNFDKKEMIDKLKLEIEVIRKGGYYPSVREPRREPRVFRDSVTCLNVGLEEKKEPCSSCFLIEFVPPEQRDKEDPCHHIPLNKRGDTVASLQSQGAGRDTLQAALLDWLYVTLAKLEKEVARGQ
jgi:hypothetical protein